MVREDRYLFPQAGFLASGSPYRPRLPICFRQWRFAAFVPGYSGGSAPFSDSLFIPVGKPADIVNIYIQFLPDCQAEAAGLFFFIFSPSFVIMWQDFF